MLAAVLLTDFRLKDAALCGSPGKFTGMLGVIRLQRNELVAVTAAADESGDDRENKTLHFSLPRQWRASGRLRPDAIGP